MIVSMTGFGQATRNAGGYRLHIDARSVNHRYAEIVIRLPREAQPFEDALKKTVQQSIKRGRVDVYVTVEREASAGQKVDIDWSLADAYVQAAERLKERFGLSETIRIADLLQIPQLLRLGEAETSDADVLESELQACLQEALGQLMSMREAEGLHLRTDLRSRLAEMEKLCRSVRGRAQQVADEYRSRLRGRLAELLEGIPLDEGRVIAEAAVFADRSNIDEELTRLASHFIQFAQLIDGGEPPGRRLDFLLQEMNREVNTIGSKANDALIAGYVVAMKAELEKMREQVQNVE
ncbi:YicC/YloC family endoribonuclease [Paenibacillus sp. MBLB4367]|uniref:YicC/YloC family endoribonuclease n=1 Tax=Paenibacillus sp. MBLB4367 TaxID=3384767 RepID=UPI003907FE9A